MAWNRVARLIIGASPKIRGGGAVLESTALDVSALHFEFVVTQAIAFEDGTAEITIFNMNKTSRSSITEGLSVIIEAGYEDAGVGAIFVGEIRQVRHSHASTDWITKIKATSGRPVLSRLANTSLTLSYRAGSKLSQVVEEIGVGIGVMVVGAENIANVVLQNGFYYCGRYQPLINRVRAELAARQVGFYVDFNQMVIYKVGSPSDIRIVSLDQTSGLLEAKLVRTAAELANSMNAKKHKVPVTKADLRDRISFTSLLLPKIRPNKLVHIVGAEIVGNFLVEKAKYTGDNYGKEWKIEGEATHAS